MQPACAVLIAAAGVSLLALALPNLAASIVRAPGQQAIAIASAGADIHQHSFARAADSLRAASRFRERKGDFADLVVIHENLGRQQASNSALRDRLYAEGLAAFRDSARLSPVDPSGWLLAAQMHYQLGEREAAAHALEWSLRTSVYRQQHAVQRAFVGLGVWDLLPEATLDRLAPSLETAFARAPEGFVGWAVELGLEDAIEARLAALEAARPRQARPATTPAQRFATAVANHRLARQAALEDLREVRTMRRALLASSMLITIGLPLPGQAITIADYIDMRDNADDAAAEAQLNDYLGGVLDGLVMLGALSQGSDAARFCMPDENVVELDVLAFRRELDAMLEQLEDEVAGFAELARTRTLGLAAVQLLAVQHPCGD